MQLVMLDVLKPCMIWDVFILLAAGAFLVMLLLVILDITIGIKHTIKRHDRGDIMLYK